MKQLSKIDGRFWLTLLAAPILFFLGIILASIYFGVVTQGAVDEIPDLVAASTPYQLVVIQLLLLVIVNWARQRDGLTWAGMGWQTDHLWRELLIGAVPGAALGLLYIFLLSPRLTWVQQTVGDYVPAGELLPTLGRTIVPFFIADVLLAPFVEESLYRGYALTRLTGRFRPPVAIALSCFFFGLLHWTGGFWYILLTGIVAGGLFAGLFVTRRNVVAPFAAHLALNMVEFLFVALALVP